MVIRGRKTRSPTCDPLVISASITRNLGWDDGAEGPGAAEDVNGGVDDEGGVCGCGGCVGSTAGSG
jgi:hypothetical protein